MDYTRCFDVIVVGGGHAGCEAAWAAARMGAECLLITHNINTIGTMSCNPSIGGVGKGQLVKEIDAMGGLMGQAADEAGIHFRILNASKGAAVQATRAQADRVLYKKAVRARIESHPKLTLFQQAVGDLLIEGDRVVGVITEAGIRFRARAVVCTLGTFLGGKIHIGSTQAQGGRAGDPASLALAGRLRDLPFRVGRLKTGTPPRIDGRSLDFSCFQPQPGDEPRPVFSIWQSRAVHPRQVSCYIAKTNLRTHDIIRGALDRSPLFTGAIEGLGPRYCPSIEDKVTRFDRESHQIFMEPEGLDTYEIYPNGISTSLPFDVQLDLVRSIKGCEGAHLTQAGYAIEYDFFDPRDLYPSLESKFYPNLFFAGQINGTTGYEEAAAQGLVAGINAAAKALDKAAWHPSRTDSYIGVLVSDLITQGAKEPYRMFTSRSEYRLQIREDNAAQRMSPLAYELGLLSEAQWQHYCAIEEAIARGQHTLAQQLIRPQTEMAQSLKTQVGIDLEREYRAVELLKRPEVSYADLAEACAWEDTLPELAARQLEIRIKYEGYIARQQDEVERVARFEALSIPLAFDYRQVSGLSNEVIQKLQEVRPTTLGQAARIPGVTPAAISLLLVFLKKLRST